MNARAGRGLPSSFPECGCHHPYYGRQSRPGAGSASIVGAMACPRPVASQKSYAHPYNVEYLTITIICPILRLIILKQNHFLVHMAQGPKNESNTYIHHPKQMVSYPHFRFGLPAGCLWWYRQQHYYNAADTCACQRFWHGSQPCPLLDCVAQSCPGAGNPLWHLPFRG